MDSVNFRSALPQENSIFGAPHRPITNAPPLPPRIQPGSGMPQYGGQSNSYGGAGGMYNSYGGGGVGGYGMGGGGYGGGMFNSYSTGLYGGAGGGGYNRYASPYYQQSGVESRFIQMAEDNSRPAFQSIESFVGLIGNFASMLDSTFFALTSSFRAVLGVTANLGKLRSMFGQFLSSMAMFRGLHWLWRKVLYTLRVSNLDPSSSVFREAFNLAQNAASVPGGPNQPPPVSAWPMVLFLSFIFATPYVLMKFLGRPDAAASDSLNPRTWNQPIQGEAAHTFHASSAQELTIVAGDIVYMAPIEIQNAHRLQTTGWVLATKDFVTAGLVPFKYLQEAQQQQPQKQLQEAVMPALAAIAKIPTAAPTSAAAQSIPPAMSAGSASSGDIIKEPIDSSAA